MKNLPEAAGNYVYRLIDPRNGETFYIGKGKGNRVFNHVSEAAALRSDEEDAASLKLSRISEIQNAGLEVIHVIHRHDIPNAAIYEVEAALIDAFPGLTNIQGGHGSGSKGPMNAKEIIDKYELPMMEQNPVERLVLLNINRLEDQSDREIVYKQTQLAWRISKKKAEIADFVLGVVRGVVVGAFVAEEWLSATRKNFPDRLTDETEMPGRNGFKGEIAPNNVWEKFVGTSGKRISNDEMKHVQNPVRYWNI